MPNLQAEANQVARTVMNEADGDLSAASTPRPTPPLQPPTKSPVSLGTPVLEDPPTPVRSLSHEKSPEIVDSLERSSTVVKKQPSVSGGMNRLEALLGRQEDELSPKSLPFRRATSLDSEVFPSLDSRDGVDTEKDPSVINGIPGIKVDGVDKGDDVEA
jgi:hypothetical protein